MRSVLRPALVSLMWFTLITGAAYPAVLLLIGRVAFPVQASGSVIVRGGHSLGSRLIGQSFESPRYFWGRLSATAGVPYDATASTGSNFGPLSPALAEAERGRMAALRAADSGAAGPVPADLLTASGSGLDPDISPAAAEYQLNRVARSRGLAPDSLRSLVLRFTTPRFQGVIGEPVVNVLELNLALDAARDGGGTRER